jgi:hypothetical protein
MEPKNITSAHGARIGRPVSRTPVLIVIGFLLLLAALGCGAGGTSSDAENSPGSESGQVIIGLTDAQGDFVTYTVDVLSLTLTKANGVEVHTLPLETSVDFAQYTEMTEFLTAATIPIGTYVKATMELDYQNADIRVEDGEGHTQVVDDIRDEDGNAITTMTVSVHLKDRNSLTIVPGVPAHLTLDFDLEASNRVTFGEDEISVTVEPMLLATVNPEEPKLHRVRGPLKDVDVASASFDIIIRPFIHLIKDRHERFGILKVETDDNTIFDIDGEQEVGSPGLQLLADKKDLTAVVALGDLVIVAGSPPRFQAREVYAGSSVPGGTLDVVVGNVVKRQDDTLTVRGATLIRAEGSVVFNDRVDVLLGADTIVKRQFSQASFDTMDISVGQRIRVFGVLDEDEIALDATQGHARMLLTTLKGSVVAVDDTTLDLDLAAINGRRIALFDFTGTGETEDADPANYVIDPKSLSTASLEEGLPVKVKGFVTPFGHAEGEADFEAQTIMDLSHARALMHVTWWPASSDGIYDLTEMGFSLNLTGHGRFHHVARHGLITDLTAVQTDPYVEPSQHERRAFFLRDSLTHELRSYLSFEGFVDALSQYLDEGRLVKGILSNGRYTDDSVTLTADHITVILM